jgi:hypothetical protein
MQTKAPNSIIAWLKLAGSFWGTQTDIMSQK